MDIKTTFEESVAASKSLPNQSNENLLKLYSLYKQASEGDVNVEKPTNFFDFAAIAKFNAWESLKGVSKENAMQQYIDLVKSLGN
ncbi:acyl-CoA-binding protein [Cytophaga hutchinsonii]|jgi:diazepam-binding inhibitor (GABA receptor modulating acyl-CoA-binding protein)|uniref:Acyl-CoA-binding protein n=1 Tax=Cytophaga hutchinsonii (strain ATCC 33406 / DSM 1761 / CIP 103989 / NBRC 15051 / NCIMB 9469 / D465) TaxID=269798 RepID=A0A6N4SVU3_CYTH3|nr:acyl-CoA-binding protein [Cytophaga hutchinsonii]ABG60493.1 acyl-CoA-binding protein [Cytophaga hutchinsonii ATCC 33406]SFX84786.1 Acyl-CoA-binding protein [Cytophaga hutchinsonii ATCC 33406]